MDLLAQVLFERRNVIGEAPEHDTERLGEPELSRIMVFHAEGGGHAALAFDPFLERDLLEVALPVVAPGVIDAGERLGVATALQRDQRTTVRAAVFERVELA